MAGPKSCSAAAEVMTLALEAGTRGAVPLNFSVVPLSESGMTDSEKSPLGTLQELSAFWIGAGREGADFLEAA